MAKGMWRPADEAEATGNMAMFVEWLRATGRSPEASPEDVRRWWASEPAALLRAVAAFACAAADDPGRLAELAHRLLVDDARPAPPN